MRREVLARFTATCAAKGVVVIAAANAKGAIEVTRAVLSAGAPAGVTPWDVVIALLESLQHAPRQPCFQSRICMRNHPSPLPPPFHKACMGEFPHKAWDKEETKTAEPLREQITWNRPRRSGSSKRSSA